MNDTILEDEPETEAQNFLNKIQSTDDNYMSVGDIVTQASEANFSGKRQVYKIKSHEEEKKQVQADGEGNG